MAWNIAPNKTLWCTGWGDDTEIYISYDIPFRKGFLGQALAEGIGLYYDGEEEYIHSEISRYRKVYGDGSLYDT